MKIKFFTATLFLIVSNFVFGQAPAWAWAQGAGGSSEEEAKKIMTDANGNVYILGSLNSSGMTIGTDVLTNTGGTDPFIAKYDAQGNPQWARSGTGNGTNGAETLTVDANGYVYIAGWFGGTDITFGSHVLTNAGGCDAFVVKYDPQGNVVWARRSGGSSYDQVEGITTDAAGNVFIIGIHQNDTYTIGNISLPSSGDNDAFVAKYDSSGTAIWAQSAAGASWDDGYGIALDADDNVIISGYFGGATMHFGNISLTGSGSQNLFMTKYNACGEAIWAVNPGGAVPSFSPAVRTDGAGNIYMTGYSTGASSFNGHSITNAGGADMFLVKFNANGVAQWATSAGGNGSETANDLVVDASGNVYITGYFGSSSITFGSITLNNTCTNAGSTNSYVAKYNTNGIAQWAINPVSTVDNIGYGIALDLHGNVLVAGGYLNTDITFGSTTLTNNGNWDMYVAELGSCNGTTPIITASGPTGFCFGDSVTLTSSTAASYLWSNAATGQSIKVMASGSYTVAVPSGVGCTSTSTPTVVRVNSQVKAGVISVTPDSICSAKPVTISVSGNSCNSFQWQSSPVSTSGFSNISSATDTSYTNTFNRTTWFRVVVNNGGCSDTSASKRLLVGSAPPVLAKADTTSSCSSDSVRITVSGNYISYNWNNGDTRSYTFATLSGDYYVSVTASNGCTGVAGPITVDLKAGLQAPLLSTTDSVICSSDSTRIDVLGTYDNYNWSNGDTRPYTIVKTAGGYWVTVSDANGCTAQSGHQNINVYPVPSVSIVVQGDTLYSLNAVSYQWYRNDTLLTGAVSSVFIAAVSGDYAVAIIDSNGCRALSSKTYVDVATGIADLQWDRDWNIFPDPVTNTIFIKGMNTDVIEQLEVYNVMGQKVIRVTDFLKTPRLASMDISSLAPGLYYLSIRSAEKNYIQPIVKQ